MPRTNPGRKKYVLHNRRCDVLMFYYYFSLLSSLTVNL